MQVLGTACMVTWLGEGGPVLMIVSLLGAVAGAVTAIQSQTPGGAQQFDEHVLGYLDAAARLGRAVPLLFVRTG